MRNGLKRLLFASACMVMLLSGTAYAAGNAAVKIIRNGVTEEVSNASAQSAQTTQAAEASFEERINVPDSASVMLVLDADKDADHGTLNVYKRTADAAGKKTWQLQLTTKAMIGKKGLYKTAEGDCKTPVGVFRMNTPFGISDSLAGFPANYRKVDGNLYWVGDSASAYYNRLVDKRSVGAFSTKASEHIIDYPGYYNYCIDTGYNIEGTAGKGSAIFLHCVVGNENTHGCIAIPEADMISVMRLFDEGNTYIAIYDHADPEAVCRK